MYNNYYRINESRWELPEETNHFKYPDYEKRERNIDKDKENFKEGWDKNIIEELTKFYNEYKDFIVTEYDKLENNKCYSYIDFSYPTPIEIEKAKKCYSSLFNPYNPSWEYNTYLVREVIRKHPELNPSYILFKIINPILFYSLSRKLSCFIKKYMFKYIQAHDKFKHYSTEVCCMGRIINEIIIF